MTFNSRGRRCARMAMWVGLLTILKALAATASAQSAFISEMQERVIDQRLASALTAINNLNLSLGLVDRGRGVLNEGGEATIVVPLKGGNKGTIVSGVCDPGCTLLDLQIVGPDGQMVAADTDDDDMPVAAFNSIQAGNHVVKIRMRGCTTSRLGTPCAYGYLVAQQ